MTERATGGSANLINGTIEIIHNRRLTNKDSKGLNEILNEKD